MAKVILKPYTHNLLHVVHTLRPVRPTPAGGASTTLFRAITALRPQLPKPNLPVSLQVADEIDDLKLGNGTSLLIFANIGSALPTSVGAALTTGQRSPTNLAIYAAAFLATTLGIVYVQVSRVFAHNMLTKPFTPAFMLTTLGHHVCAGKPSPLTTEAPGQLGHCPCLLDVACSGWPPAS